jgi:hypothetical protein
MANLRTQLAIPALSWTLIINGVKTASVYRKKFIPDPGYLTIAYDDAVSDPNTLVITIDPASDTVEGMVFDENNEWKFDSPANGYVWAAPSGSESGILVVT